MSALAEGLRVREMAQVNSMSAKGNTIQQTLKGMAKLLRVPEGPEIAALDLGGWDTHSRQGRESGRFARVFSKLSRGSSDLAHGTWLHMAGHRGRLRDRVWANRAAQWLRQHRPRHSLRPLPLRRRNSRGAGHRRLARTRRPRSLRRPRLTPDTGRRRRAQRRAARTPAPHGTPTCRSLSGTPPPSSPIGNPQLEMFPLCWFEKLCC